MKRKEKLDFLRASLPFEAVRPDVRSAIFELRADSFDEPAEVFGFGPRPQSVALGRALANYLVRQKRSAFGRDLAFRYATDSKKTEKLALKIG